MRITHVACSDAFAGVERYMTSLATGQARAGADVLVIGGRGDRMVAALEAVGARWAPGVKVGDTLFRLLRSRRPDVVHAHMTAGETVAVVASPAVRAPIVATRHFAQTRGSSGPARVAGRIITRRVAAQLAISRFVADRTATN